MFCIYWKLLAESLSCYQSYNCKSCVAFWNECVKYSNYICPLSVWSTCQRWWFQIVFSSYCHVAMSSAFPLLDARYWNWLHSHWCGMQGAHWIHCVLFVLQESAPVSESSCIPMLVQSWQLHWPTGTGNGWQSLQAQQQQMHFAQVAHCLLSSMCWLVQPFHPTHHVDPFHYPLDGK